MEFSHHVTDMVTESSRAFFNEQPRPKLGHVAVQEITNILFQGDFDEQDVAEIVECMQKFGAESKEASDKIIEMADRATDVGREMVPMWDPNHQ